MTPAGRAGAPEAALGRMFVVFAAAYFLSYALRAVNAAIAPSLVADLGLTREQLGALTGAYLVAFALAQVPLGLALDRFGPRRVESLLMCVAAAGCAAFALAESASGLWLARATIGVGVSACFMAAMTGFRRDFPPAALPRLALGMLAVGTAGVIAMTLPAQLAAQAWGWRALFVALACACLAAAAALWWGLPRAPGAGAVAASPGPAVAPPGYAMFLRDPWFWRMAMIAAGFQGSFVAIQTLWLGPWLTQVEGWSASAAAGWLLAFNVVLLGGWLASAWLAPRIQRSRLGVERTAGVAALVYVAAQAVAAGGSGPIALAAWMVFGLACTLFVLAQSHLGLHYPAAVTGRLMTSFNVVLFGCAFAMQWGFGAVADAFAAAGASPADAMRSALWVFVALQAAMAVAYNAWRPPAPVAASALNAA